MTTQSKHNFKVNTLQQLLVKRFLGFTLGEAPGLTWAQAYRAMLHGKSVRRPVWRKDVQVSWNARQRFLTVSNKLTLWSGNWTPYADDFAATDWEIVG